MTVGIVGGFSSFIIGHHEAVSTAECEAWRLSNELFLIGLLSAICRDKGRRDRFKPSCFEAFRRNEADASTYLQRWWRRLRPAPVKVSAIKKSVVVRSTSRGKAAVATSSPPIMPSCPRPLGRRPSLGDRRPSWPEDVSPAQVSCCGVGGLGVGGLVVAVVASPTASSKPMMPAMRSARGGGLASAPVPTLPAAVSAATAAKVAPLSAAASTSSPAVVARAAVRSSRPPPIATTGMAIVASSSSTSLTPATRAAAGRMLASSRGTAGSNTGSSAGGSNTSTPTGQESRRTALSGDNPYRRKWNPRLAAQQRRERENQTKSRDEESQQRRAEQLQARCILADQCAAEDEEAATAELLKSSNHAAPLPQEQAPATGAMFGCRGGGRVAPGDDPEDPRGLSEYGTVRAGFSMNAPQDRGPEHQPGAREMQAPGLREPTGYPEAYAPAPTTMLTPRERQRKRELLADARQIDTQDSNGTVVATSSVSPRLRSQVPRACDRNEMYCDSPLIVDADENDFARIQQLISSGLASAEAGEEPSLEIDAAAHCSPALRDAARNSGRGKEAQSRAEENDEPLRPGGSRMAAARLAAEQRAYGRRNLGDEVNSAGTVALVDVGPDNLSPTQPAPTAANRSSAAMRAIAERRAAAPPASGLTSYESRAGPGPRDEDTAAPPRTSGGAYRPAHVYSGRSEQGGGGGLSGKLGLRFGQPPPARDGAVGLA